MSTLVQYVDNVLTPSDNQKKFIKSGIRSIQKVLTHNSPITPKEIHRGGSLATDTMLAHKLDADLVYVYNKIEEIGNNWEKLAKAVYKPLESNFPEVAVEEAGNLAIHIKTSFEERPVNFDIVPCYYVNSPIMMKEHTNSKLYTGITTIWHTRYLERYKNLRYFTHVVRLLKDWKREQDVPLKSLHLALIAADIYDNIIEDINNVGELENVLMLCFENILDTLDGYPVIPSCWRYCNESNYEDQYDSPKLYDPANPIDNLLAHFEATDIKKIRRKTEITMENLKEGYYADIFNRKGLTKFFD